MSTQQIHVFISHSWSYSGHFDTLSNWIFGNPWRSGQATLDFRDFSVPRNDPIHNASNDKQLRDAIFNKIGRSHIVVIPTGMYAGHSKWIKKEIEGAKQYGKPILAVTPWAQQRKSSVVIANADASVGWNKEVVAQKIWELHRS